jgi:type IV pilus assembly protein PilA
MKDPSSRTPFWIVLTRLIIAGPLALLLLILMALAIPQGLRLRKKTNQTSAILTINTIGRAEIAYNATYPAQGYACSLRSLGGDPKSGPPSPSAAQRIDPTLASAGRKSGYTFTVACGKKLVNQGDTYTSYRVYAVPDSVGRSGDNGFCADEQNIITVDPAGGTNCSE